MTRLIVWRHGRTEWTSRDRVQGHTDVDLDHVGLRQAADSAPAIAAFGPDLIVSSDLRRAAHTAAALAEVTGLPVEYDARLRERDFGPWHGLTAAEIERDFPTSGPVARWPAPDHHGDRDRGRPCQARHARVPGRRRPGWRGTPVVVTHGGTARVGCAGLLGWPAAAWHTLGGLGTAVAPSFSFSTSTRLAPDRVQRPLTRNISPCTSGFAGATVHYLSN